MGKKRNQKNENHRQDTGKERDGNSGNSEKKQKNQDVENKAQGTKQNHKQESRKSKKSTQDHRIEKADHQEKKQEGQDKNAGSLKEYKQDQNLKEEDMAAKKENQVSQEAVVEKKSKAPILLCICIILLGIGIGGSIHSIRKQKRQKEDEMQKIPQVIQTKAPRGHNEDETSNLGAWGRAMGSVLISINDGDPYYFGGYEVNRANKKAAARILKQSWEVSNRKDLLKKIKWLVETGDREEYQKEKKEMDALSRKEWNTAIKQLSGGLKVHYQNLRNNWLAWGKRGLLAWDLCRISHLVQWGYIAGYIELDEAQALLEPAATILKSEFGSWDDVTGNWLDGYALAMTVSMEAPASIATLDAVLATSQPSATFSTNIVSSTDNPQKGNKSSKKKRAVVSTKEPSSPDTNVQATDGTKKSSPSAFPKGKGTDAVKKSTESATAEPGEKQAEEELSDYFYRKQVYEELVEGQEKRGVLYDDALFQEEIIPLQDVSYTSVMKEIKKVKKKPTPAPSGKKKNKKENKEEQ